MDYTKLSKEVSYALRHAPWEYELELDSEGFVPIEQLINAINESGNYNRPITINDLERIIEISDKKRHEIQGDKIRALYGHSIPMHISKQKVTPPDVLYHGTTHKAIGSVMNEGLKLMGRQYVHLSVDRETAFSVGRRRDKNPIILLIDSKKAFADGIAFYSGNDKVYLSDSIPSEYISF